MYFNSIGNSTDIYLEERHRQIQSLWYNLKQKIMHIIGNDIKINFLGKEINTGAANQMSPLVVNTLAIAEVMEVNGLDGILYLDNLKKCGFDFKGIKEQISEYRKQRLDKLNNNERNASTKINNSESAV